MKNKDRGEDKKLKIILNKLFKYWS